MHSNWQVELFRTGELFLNDIQYVLNACMNDYSFNVETQGRYKLYTFYY